jgi:hypothetical protein
MPARTFGEIFGATFAIYRENASQLLLIVAVVVIPLSVLEFLVSRVAFTVKTHTVIIGGRAVQGVPEARSAGIVLLAALFAAAISIITYSILQAAILRAAAQATIGDPLDVDASYRWGLTRFGSVIWVAILVGICVAIGLILLVIPGLIVLVMLCVSVPACVVENVRGTQALSRSWNLVRGSFWHVVGVIVVAALISGAVNGLLTSIAGNSSVLRLILSTIAQLLVAPFSALIAVLLYLDLRARHENLTASALRAELNVAP